MQTELRRSLALVYDHYAAVRERDALQNWKLEERMLVLDTFRKEGTVRVLEIGAGTGKDSRFFLENGLDVVAVDLSPKMVEFCRSKGVDARLMDMAEADFPDASFDAVYSMNSLLHIPKDEMPSLLGNINRILSPGGLFYIGIHGGRDHEGIWERDSYRPQRFFSFYSDAHLQQVVSAVFDVCWFKPVILEREDHRLADKDKGLYFQSVLLQKKPVESQSSLYD